MRRERRREEHPREIRNSTIEMRDNFPSVVASPHCHLVVILSVAKNLKKHVVFDIYDGSPCTMALSLR